MKYSTKKSVLLPAVAAVIGALFLTASCGDGDDEEAILSNDNDFGGSLGGGGSEADDDATPAGGEDGVVNVYLQNFMASPDTVHIAAGGTVRWTNRDSVAHTVISGNPWEADAGSEFSSGLLGNGANFEHTFVSAGEYLYFCRPHQTMMYGFLVVVGP